jgi:glycosyltransferase involved in cell wall biosynthesis
MTPVTIDGFYSPKVSIVIPVHNGANYVDQAIRSALAQTYLNCEVIVVNDGSNDDGQTDRVVRSFGSQIRYEVKENGGVASALNLALRTMTGEYFSWLSHDDLYFPEKIERQIDWLRRVKNSDAILYCDYSIFSNESAPLRVRMPEVPAEQFQFWLTSCSMVNGCTLLIPKEALLSQCGFDETLWATQDYDMWFKLAEKRSFLHVPENLVASRIHAQQSGNRFVERSFRESCDLHARFVQSLSQKIVQQHDRSSASDIFLMLANSLWLRGFQEAAQFAEKQATEFGAGSARVFVNRLLAQLKFKMIVIARQIFSPMTRLKIRQYLDSFIAARSEPRP